MKRRTLKFIACASIMALTLSVTACGGSDDKSSNDAVSVEKDAAENQVEDKTESEVEDKTETEIKLENEADVEEEASAGDEEYFETLEEAFAQPEVKAAMDEELSSVDMDGMELSYEVTGNEFIVTYKMTDTAIDDVDDFAEQMEPVMDQLGGIFSMVAEAFDESLGKEGATTVTVRFFDSSDTLLIEASYKAE